MGFAKKFKHIGKRLAKLPRAVWKTPQTKENLDILKHRVDIAEQKLNEHNNHKMIDAYGTMIHGMQKSLENFVYQVKEVSNIIDAYGTMIHGMQKSLENFAYQVKEVSNIKANIENIKVEIDIIRNRLEFARKEIFFEVQKNLRGVKTDTSKNPDCVNFRVLNEEKIKNISRLDLNLGCGHVPKEGFINVDFRELPDVDIIADVGNLAFEKNSVNTIYAAHLIEHFTFRELKDNILPHWYDLLKKGGQLITLAPDAQAMFDAYAKDIVSFEDFREVMYGSQDYDGDYHFNMLTTDSTIELFTQIGFSEVKLIEQGRKNGLCYEFEIHAIK